MIGRIFNTLIAVYLFYRNVQVFHPDEIFRNQRVAIIGAASSAFEEENGSYIDGFDLVVRVNKALYTWQPEQEKYLGKKADILFHSFYENQESGGGPIDEFAFAEFGLQYLVQPINSLQGKRTQLNFYKRHLRPVETYVLSKEKYLEMKDNFDNWTPTVGFSALYAALSAPCSEIYITGFSFFKTPYGKGYRDHLLDPEANENHLKTQGLHNPELEFRLFRQLLKDSPCPKIGFDNTLAGLVQESQ